jgi:hypothetical protein
LINGSGCTNQPLLRPSGGTAGLTTNSDTTLTVDSPGAAQLDVELVGCSGELASAPSCFGPVVTLATVNVTVFQ